MSTGDIEAEPPGIVADGACRTYTAIDSRLQDVALTTPADLKRIASTLSPARMHRFKINAGDDLRLAIRLHHFNAAVAAALLPTIQLAEVAVRNFALRRVIAFYGKRWYDDKVKFGRKLGSSQHATTLEKAVAEERNQGRKGDINDYITSELPFGFWVNIFTRTFIPDLWTRPLHTYNPSIPNGTTIDTLRGEIDALRRFRNDVAHHKNLITKPIEARYQRSLVTLSWICRPTADMAQRTATFPMIWACCPVPQEMLASQSP